MRPTDHKYDLKILRVSRQFSWTRGRPYMTSVTEGEGQSANNFFSLDQEGKGGHQIYDCF